MTTGIDIPKKIELLKKIVSTQSDAGGFAMNESEHRYTVSDQVIRMVMGLTILAIGLYSALCLGLANVFSEDNGTKAVAQFLVFIGLLFGQVGAGFVQFVSRNRRWVGQALFCLCFLISAAIIVVGLKSVFSTPPVGIYLMLIGFASAIIAAFAMK